MDSKANSPVADSGGLSPKSITTTANEVDPTTTTTSDQYQPQQPQVPAKVKLMVSYGGRIQPRPTDQQLSYVNGETKILSVDRTVGFAEFYAKLASLAGVEDLRVKYQLPGEDLDSLVSVTNDEDVEHLVHEYDRLPLTRPVNSNSTKSTARLRVFLFTINTPSPPPPTAGANRQWFAETPNSFPNPPAPKPETAILTAHAAEKTSQAPAPAPTKPELIDDPVTANPAPPVPTRPDYLFGLDKGFVPPPAVKVKDPAGQPPTARENVPVEIEEDKMSPPQINGNGGKGFTVTGNGGEHVSAAMSPFELQRRQIEEFDNNNHSPSPPPVKSSSIPRNGSDEALARGGFPAPPPPAITTPHPEFFLSKFPEKPPVPPPTGPTGFLPVQGSMVAGRFASVAGDNHGGQYYVIHAPSGVYPPPHQGFYPGPPGGASYPTVYAVSPTPVPTQVVNPQQSQQQVADGSTNAAAAVTVASYAPQQMAAFDSTGRPVYYTSMLPPPYAPVSGVPLATTEAAAKPVVKPMVS